MTMCSLLSKPPNSKLSNTQSFKVWGSASNVGGNTFQRLEVWKFERLTIMLPGTVDVSRCIHRPATEVSSTRTVPCFKSANRWPSRPNTVILQSYASYAQWLILLLIFIVECWSALWGMLTGATFSTISNRLLVYSKCL